MRLLVLGGTAEARALAVALESAGVDFVSSLAGRVAHLRDPPRAHEARHLDPAESGAGQHVDQRDLFGGGDQPLFVLQPVARAHFKDLDVIGHAAASAGASVGLNFS